MQDLLDRLQSALGDAYRIERELGGGGMSHVFLARETALGREVVIKVLPPEMAASVNLERFRREIQLAASLQHPHIVPLLAAGQVGDLFYYTMPLVAGESLRAKLAREGELPVGDAIRILRDVVDALAYAHARGVVHRDVKPDNVLITGQHAMVTDFGVAKAMSAASGSASLTSLGVALGTPAYMAPEQAAADPHVDHRADLYAVGAMAYEMLSGRPPFSGMSPQQVLAAQVTLPPAPLNAQRPSVPPALNALVMRCLEKKPADRVQSATELLIQLQVMATPTGGTMPTGAHPVFGSSADSALRRTHRLPVSVLFALMSAVVLATVFQLRERLGLPDWVLPGAAVLLALGLPIMLLTARMERDRLLAKSTGTSREPDVGVARLFTWRKAISGGLLAFGALTAIVIGYTKMRAWGVGSIGTLQAKGLLKPRQPILLAEFENRSGDSTLGPTLTEAFRVDLSQSQTVKLVDGQAVSDALTRMQKPANAMLAPSLAREVAVREGVPAIVAGQIDPVGRSFVISVKVLSAPNNAVLTALRETAASDLELIPAVDRLSRALRERIGESLVSIRNDPPLEHVTTGSLDALRKYSEAVRLSDMGRDEAAVPLLQEATAIDTGFAMAWRLLAVALSNSGGPLRNVREASVRAYRRRDRLPELEKQATIARYFGTVDRDPTKEIAAYRSMLAIDPENDIALNDLSIALYARRDYPEAESLAVRCMAHGQFGSCPDNAISAQVQQGKLPAAESTLARWSRGSPHDPIILNERFALASWQHDYARSEQYARDLAAAEPSSSLWQEQSTIEIGAAEGTQGKLRRADVQIRAVAALSEARVAGATYVLWMARLAQLHLRVHVRPDDALATLAAALRKHPFATMDSTDRPYTDVAIAYALGGRSDEARRLMADYARTVPPTIQKGDMSRFLAAGVIDMADKRYGEALRNFQASRIDNPLAAEGLFEIADAFARLSQPDSSRAYLERYVANGDLFRVFLDVDHLAAAYQRLGEQYEEKGDRKRAIEYYLKLTDLWKEADPELQPIVADAHLRIARLSAEQ